MIRGEGRGGVRRRNAAAGLAAGVLAACATGTASSGPPVSNPAELAEAARGAGGAERPYRIRLSWEYTDERGPVSGDGVLRYNPTDSLRLDLFGPGGGSMSVALAGAGLRSVGRIRDVRMPPPAFLYASAGIFRPGRDEPARGYRRDGTRVLVYPAEGAGELRFHLGGDRLQRVEEVREGRILRRIELEWPEETGAVGWPASARYRDRMEGSRARWELEAARPADSPFPADIYDLPAPDTP